MNASASVPRGYAKILIGAIAACWLIAAGTAQAATNWTEKFDTYANGSQVVGQGGWQPWDNTPAISAIVTNAHAFSGNNSIRIAGTALTAGNYSDLVHQFTGYTSGTWLFSAWQYVPSGATGNSYFILNDNYSDGGPYNSAIQYHFNLAAGTVVDEGAGQTSSSLPIVLDQWTQLQFQINLAANTVSAYYNGSLLVTHAWATGANALNQIRAVDLYSDVSSAVFYDNVSLTLVPEPTLFGLLAAFGVTFSVWRRRSARS
jgi:hypothetical protein